MAKLTITVFGSTGKQGSSVVKSILADSKASSQFHVKAVTRDPSKDSARALASLGAEVVAGDFNDKQSLHAAIKGAWGVFSVTNFWELFSAEAEAAQGKAVADVCKAEGVKHLIWSSLFNVNKLSNGVLPGVVHFDGKADVEDYIRSLGIPASFFHAGFYMSNLPGQSLRDMGDGNWALAMPNPADAPIPLFDAAADTGKFVKAMFLNHEKLLGKSIYGATAYYTPTQIVDEFKELFPNTGKKMGFSQLPGDVFKSIVGSTTGAPEPIQEALLQNMRLLKEFGYYGGDKLEPNLAILTEKPTTWKEFAKKEPLFAGLN
ncbi:MAG: hypothetical protein Q9210_000608 [Variospora velana]